MFSSEWENPTLSPAISFKEVGQELKVPASGQKYAFIMLVFF